MGVSTFVVTSQLRSGALPAPSGLLVPADQTEEIADPTVQISAEDPEFTDDIEVRAEDAAG